MFQLNQFSVPPGFRGKNKLYVQFWWCIQATLFSKSPQFMYSWRVFLLKLFGAKIGKRVIIRPSVRITYPWNLEIGDYSWVGDYVELYTLGKIRIGNNTVVSQRSYICTGTHDYSSVAFNIEAKPIYIGDSTWIATDVFVAPGVSIGQNCVIGARSSVFKDIEDNSICYGNPAIKKNTKEI